MTSQPIEMRQTPLFSFRGKNGEIDWTFIALAALIVAGRIVFYKMTWFTTDDAFITYRYARNIASGLGFVFNAGDHVQGTSSPLYSMWLAALGAMFGTSAIPMLSRLTGIAADVVTLFLLRSMFANAENTIGLLVGVVFALYPKIVLIAISGMEAPVVVMLMFLIWRWYMLDRTDLVFFGSSLLLLTRLDAGLWLLIMGIALFLRAKPVPVMAAIIAAGLYGAWVGFCYWYFGSWLPHSVTAKAVAWNHLFPQFDPIRIMAGYLPGTTTATMSGARLTLAITVLCIPIIVEGVLSWRERSENWILSAFFVAYNCAYAFGRVIMPDWYYYPGYVAYVIVCGQLIARLLPIFRKYIPVQFHAVLRVAFLILVFFFLGAGYRSGASRWADNPGGLFLRQNDALGLWLNKNAHPASSVLLEPIGYVGWESNLYIHDYIGLVSPAIVDYRKHAFQSDRWYMSYIKDQAPDYIVQRNWEYKRNTLFHGYGEGMFTEPDDREWFDKHYATVNWNPHAADRDSVYLVLYEKTDNTPLFGALTSGAIIR